MKVTVNPDKHATTRLYVSSHKLELSWSGAGDDYARGRCECGWHFKGWTHRQRDVRLAHQRHLIDLTDANAHVKAHIQNVDYQRFLRTGSWSLYSQK